MSETPEQDHETPQPDDNSIGYRVFGALFEVSVMGLFFVLPLLALVYVGYWLKAGDWPRWTLLSIAPFLLPDEIWEWEGLYKLWFWFLTAPIAVVPALVLMVCLLAALALAKLHEWKGKG